MAVQRPKNERETLALLDSIQAPTSSYSISEGNLNSGQPVQVASYDDSSEDVYQLGIVSQILDDVVSVKLRDGTELVNIM